MIVEVARLNVKPGLDKQFEAAFEKAHGKAKSKGKGFSVKLCEAYLDASAKHFKAANVRLSKFEKQQAEKGALARKEKANKEAMAKQALEAQKEDKKLAGLLKDMAMQLSKLKPEFDASGAVMAKSLSDMGKIMKSSALKGDQKRNTMENVFEKADKSYQKQLPAANKVFLSTAKLRSTLGKVTKNSDPKTIKTSEQFEKVVEALKLARAKAQSSHADATGFLAKAKNELEKNSDVKFDKV